MRQATVYLTPPEADQLHPHPRCAKFDQWVRGAVGVKEGHPCPLFEGAISGNTVWVRAARTAEAAVYGCGGGSSKTYRAHVNEDIAGGILKEERRDGKSWVTYSDGLYDVLRTSPGPVKGDS